MNSLHVNNTKSKQSLYNVEIEKKVLAAAIKFPDAREKALKILVSEDFHDPRHVIIFRALNVLHGKYPAGFDLLVLADYLRQIGEYETIVGNNYLAQEVIQADVTGAYIQRHCKIVKDYAVRREAARQAQEILNNAGNYELSVIQQKARKIATILTGAADTAQATEPPLPLVRVIEPAKPFPVDALGPILGPAAKVIQRATKAPMAMCGNSVLAAATLAVQPYADIEIDGRVFPLSNFFLTVGGSGERKTAVDDLALFPHTEIQDTRTVEYKREKKLFEKEMEIYKKAKDKALSQKNKERDAMREALAPPKTPAQPPASYR